MRHLIPLVILLLCMPHLVLAKSTGTKTFTRIKGKAAIAMDISTGELLYEQNPDKAVAPASLTKLMTLLLIFDALAAGEAKLTDTVKASKKAVRITGSRMCLRAGDTPTLEKLVAGLAVASGNDASRVVAEYLAGSIEKFVRRMNKKAAELGMKNTTFKTPHGLHKPGQTTTASDMLTLAKHYVQTYPEALKYHSMRVYTYKRCHRTNSNRLLTTFTGCDGLKTGYVGASGYNLAATALRGGTRVVAVVLGARNPNARARETSRLMEASFAKVNPMLAYPHVKPPTPSYAAQTGGSPHEDVVAAGLQHPITRAQAQQSSAWGALKSRLRKEDELWRFIASSGKGYAIIRKGEIAFSVFGK